MINKRSSEPPADDPIISFVGKNPGLAAALLVLILALLKLAAVTHYDITTMVTLASTVGAGSILTGTFFSPPWPALLVLVTLSVRWVLLARHERWSVTVPLAVSCVVILYLILLLPTWGVLVLVTILVLLLGEAGMRRIPGLPRLADHPRRRAIGVLTAGVILWVLVWSAFFNSDMWLPKEILFATTGETSDPGDVIEGYVLGEQGAWTNVLVSGQRKVWRIQSGEISERTICLHTVPNGCGGRTWESQRTTRKTSERRLRAAS